MAAPKITKEIKHFNKEILLGDNSTYIRTLLKFYLRGPFSHHGYLHNTKDIKTWYVGKYGDECIMPVGDTDDDIYRSSYPERPLIKVIFDDDSSVVLTIKNLKKYTRKIGRYVW